MNKIIKIAVDAMGGDGSPKKVIDGIIHHFNNNKNSFYQIFGDKGKILPHIKSNLLKSSFEIIHTVDIVKGTDSPRTTGFPIRIDKEWSLHNTECN